MSEDIIRPEQSEPVNVTHPPMPSLDFLLGCSEISLGDFELASLDRSAQSLKRAKLEWEEATAQREAAGVARWLRDNRKQLLEAARRTLEVHTVPVFPGTEVKKR